MILVHIDLYMVYIKWYVALYWLPNHVWSSASSNLIHLTLLGMIYESMAPHTLMCLRFFVSGIAHQTRVFPPEVPWFLLTPQISFTYKQHHATSTRKLLKINIPMFFVTSPKSLVTSIASSPYFSEASDPWILVRSTLVIPR